MIVHFTYNEGEGVQQDGTKEYKHIVDAKREAILFLANCLQDSVQTSGVITGAVAGLDVDRKPLFSISMSVTVTDES